MFPLQHEGQDLVCFRDPEGFAEDLVVTPATWFVACCLNGETDADDIIELFRRQTGAELSRQDIEKVIQILDEAGFLATDRFKMHLESVINAFSESETREAWLAGKSYPADPDELKAFLDEQFTREGGPGPHDGAGSDTPAPGWIAPHIDFQRGGHSYAHAYGSLAKQGRPDTVFIFGVAHNTPPVPFILTRKHFETPFGTVSTDIDIVDRLADASDFGAFDYEMTHRTEHSIEFQVVMLAHLFGTVIKIVPILCGLFAEEEDRAPSSDPIIERFLSTCREEFHGAGNAIAIAGADLAHVGKRFGDAWDIDQKIVDSVSSRDREDLEHVLDLNADGWYQSVMKDANERRVCGINCIYSTLRILEGKATTGSLLHYDYAHDPAGGIVSFAGVSLA